MGFSRGVAASVFVLEIIAFSLAIGAHSKRSGAMTDRSDPATLYCRYSRDAATVLGIVAFLFLFFGQMIINGVTRCMCCSSPLTPGGNRSFAILFFVLSWFSFVIAEICLLAGTNRAAYRTRTLDRTGTPYDCASLRRGIFSAAAAFTIVTLLLSEAYYWFFCKAQDKTWQTFYGGATDPYGNPYNPGPGPYNTTGAPSYGVPYNPGAGGAYNSGPAVPGVPHSIGMTTYPRT